MSVLYSLTYGVTFEIHFLYKLMNSGIYRRYYNDFHVLGECHLNHNERSKRC